MKILFNPIHWKRQHNRMRSIATYVILVALSVIFVKCDDTTSDTDVDKQKVGKTDFGKDALERPNKCQVCRVLAQELVVELNSTKDIKKTYSLMNNLDGNTELYKKKSIDYKHSEIRLMDILDSVCKNVYNYRTVQGPAFPYLKGVKSMFRQSLEDSIKDHGLSLQLDAPDELVEDPTSELRRMFYQCNQMIEIHEDDITDWYMHKQDDNPIEYLCGERILDSNEASCLYASTEVPEGHAVPQKVQPGDKKSKFSYQSNHKNEL